MEQLFNQLEELVSSSETFYRQEFILGNARYWIYNYRLATYTEFLKPGAMEARGIMFEVDANDNPIRIASRPMQKFFNLNENPLTMNLDLSLVDNVELKADGSLMSTYTHNGEVRLKSKGSLFSEQALDAMKWLMDLSDDRRARMRGMLHALEAQGYTINLEWTAPFNRIVIGYAEPCLTVLNARHRETGDYLPREILDSYFHEQWNIIPCVNTNGLDVASFVQSIPSLTDDIEGYVCRIGDLWFKCKTEKYMSLHHAKDSITNPRRLFEAILDEGVDDLRSMFAHDALAMNTIDEMQTKVSQMYNHVVNQVESFYEQHKSDDRKTYAIAAQTMSVQGISLLGLLMQKFLGRPCDVKEFLKGKYKELGFKDTSIAVE